MARTRDYRRAQVRRANARAVYLIDWIWRYRCGRFGFARPGDRDRMIHQLRTTPKPCSCEGCGNQRRYYGRTLSEIRLDDIRDLRYDPEL